jgi:hypothetical protein
VLVEVLSVCGQAGRQAGRPLPGVQSDDQICSFAGTSLPSATHTLKLAPISFSQMGRSMPSCSASCV